MKKDLASPSEYYRHIEMKKFLDPFTETDNTSPIFSTMWDVYYLSFLIGLALDKKQSWNNKMKDNTVLLDRKMANYRTKRHNVIASTLIGYLVNQNKEISSKDELQSLIDKYIDNKGDLITFTAEGYGLINGYSYAGFEYLKNDLVMNPRDPNLAFINIYNYLNKNL